MCAFILKLSKTVYNSQAQAGENSCDSQTQLFHYWQNWFISHKKIESNFDQEYIFFLYHPHPHCLQIYNLKNIVYLSIVLKKDFKEKKGNVCDSYYLIKASPTIDWSLVI